TESGIRQIATRSANNVRISDWTFPNHNHIIVPGLNREDPWTHTFPWMVAMDDEHLLRMAFQSSAVRGDAAKRLKEYLLSNGYVATETPNVFFGKNSYNPADHRQDLFSGRSVPDGKTNELTAAQDFVAQTGQGTIVSRSEEHLGQSDAG
ncbi:MAG: iron-sulfur containing oxygenase, partial [Deltaproteobacteria bacterium]|nr:iron-sulfur containing oxygenase [Deltaproteobacteria bacterium]